MTRALQFQDPGEGIREAEVLEVLVASGDPVSEGQDVLRIETDKAEFPVSAAFGGTVEEVLVEEGDVIRVGDDLLRIADGGEEDADEPPKKKKKDKGKGKDADAREDEEETPGKQRKPKKRKQEKGRKKQKKAGEKQRDARSGRQPEQDERAETRGKAEADGDAETPSREGPVPASPATRRVARELGVDLHAVRPSGAQGRVLTEDVRAHAERSGEDAAAERPRKPGRREDRAQRERGPAELPDFSRWGPVEREPLRSVRRATARRMARAWEEIPHVTHNDVADVTALDDFRRRHAPEIEERGGRLTLTVLVMKAVAAALGEFPRFNASLDLEAEELVLKRYVHLGVALDSERGLLVPTIRDVDRKSLAELAVELRDLAERVRAGEVTPRDMAGGTFTVSNVGPLGGTHFTPIINHPQVSILGLGRARLQPVVRGTLDDYEVVPRLLLPLSLGFDHRVIDGADAARFAGRIIEMLGDVEAFALAV